MILKRGFFPNQESEIENERKRLHVNAKIAALVDRIRSCFMEIQPDPLYALLALVAVAAALIHHLEKSEENYDGDQLLERMQEKLAELLERQRKQYRDSQN